MRGVMRSLVCVAAVFLTCQRAASADQSELFIREGVELRRQGRAAEALPKFQAAYDQSHTPRASAQLGLCEFALDRWVNAEEHIRESLAARSDPWIRGKREQLEDSLRSLREHLARLEIEDAPELAGVTIAEKFRGTVAASPFWIVPGKAKVTIEAAGFRTFEQEITVAKAETKILKVTLISASVAPPSPPVARPVPPVAPPEADPIVGGIGESVPAEETSGGGGRHWGWYALGGSVVAGVAIAAVLLLGGSSPSSPDYERDIPPLQ